MKVSKNSWHMRAARKVWGRLYTPDNLCKHFWVVMSVLSLWAVLGGLGLAALGGLGFSVVKLISIWSWEFTKVVALLGGASVVVAMLYYINDKFDEVFKVRKAARAPKPVKEPGFIKSWIKAKKGRYCPLIEVSDDGEDVS